MAKTLTNFDQPLVARIHAGQKKTFVDHEVRLRRDVPGAKYEVLPPWNPPEKKSNLCKDRRHTIATDIEDVSKRETRPEPQTYSPRHQLVEPKVKAVLNLKGKRDDTSFLAEPMLAGQRSPKFYDKKHALVEKRLQTSRFIKPINEKLDALPQYMRPKQATALISPASHNPLESMKKATMANRTFYSRKGSPKSHVEMEMQRTKNNPGVGHYSIKNIEKGYNCITLGASKGWK